MASSPSAPKIRLGPTFATANDVDRDVEEALGLDPDPPTEEMEVDLAPTITQEKGVDEEIDELLSDTEDTNGQAGEIKVQEEPNWTCRWDDCYLDQEKQDILVEHVQNDHIGQGKEAYICLWENCPRKGQKQATRHSLITHCRAHTGERPYTCGEADCGKTFTRSDALTKHLRSLHGITPELPPSKKRKDPTFGIPSSSLNILGGGDSAAGSSPPPPAHSPSASMGGHSKRSEVDNVIAEVLPPSPLPPTSTETSTIIHPPPATNSSSVPPTQKHAHVRSTTEGTGKPKAKPRKSRAKAQKDKDAAAAAASPIASGSSSTLPSRIRHPPARLPPHSAFAQEGIEDMAVDVDLAAELPKLCARTAFWVESDDDEPALDLVRDHRARERVASPPYRAGEEDYDSLDEEMPPIHAERVVAETLHPDDPETVLPVLSRSNWQARYMMGKAKVMLLSEENEMRRRELMAALEEEADLDEKLAKTVKIDTVKMRTQTSGF